MYAQETFVCGSCFEDPGLVDFIRSHASAPECSFCPTEDEELIAAPVDDVSAYFIECLFREYELAVNALGWMGQDEGYDGQHWYANELALEVLELVFPQENAESLLPHLFGEYYEESWCERDPYGLSDTEWARYNWKRFRRIVMHERRYFFLSRDWKSDDPDEYSPGEVLSTIFDYAQEMDLFKDLPAGFRLVRARWEGNGPPLETALELGPPPEEKATQSNRMSPAGIPMFYACEDEETALKETFSDPGSYAVGRFETLRPIYILDLAINRTIPTLFERIPDSAKVSPRRALLFLGHVAEEMSEPIDRDDKVHINYVPTQIVTEFIRDQIPWDDKPVDGIRYRSSVHPGHVSYVLFANQGNVESDRRRLLRYDPWLKLIEVNHKEMDG